DVYCWVSSHPAVERLGRASDPALPCRSGIANASAAGASWELGPDPGQAPGVARCAPLVARAGGGIVSPLMWTHMMHRASAHAAQSRAPTVATMHSGSRIPT